MKIHEEFPEIMVEFFQILGTRRLKGTQKAKKKAERILNKKRFPLPSNVKFS
jgi:hypothetical protein